MEYIFSIDRTKAEAPVIATFALFSIFTSLLIFPFIMWWTLLLFPLMAAIFLVLSKNKMGFFKRKCFLFVNDEGIRYSFHLYQKPIFIAWELVNKVNYQLYEINIKLKSGQVVCIPVGYLKNPDDLEALKKIIETKML